ncbi:MAG: alpha/beta fold hydrolase [Planctomycetota bacterium]|nr:alpha/beta fold hydrolase [Planctomycetota bacterium]
MAFDGSAIGKLVETQTLDGLRLHGFYQQSPKSLDTLVSDRECWLIVHGVAGNFYNSSLLSSVSGSLLSIGADVLRINTRGRDAIAYFAVGAGHSRCGSAYEMICDGAVDIAAWVDAVQRQGYEKINLLGHSLGAVKSLLYVSQIGPESMRKTDSQKLSRLVLLSPPRLQSDTLKDDVKYASAYAANLAEAQQLCDEGKAETLFTIRYPQPMIVSAGTYIDKYGPASHYDYHSFLGRNACPTLWAFGEHEVRGPRSSFRDADKALMEAWKSLGAKSQSLQVIRGGDHAYTGVRDLLCHSVIDWTQATV